MQEPLLQWIHRFINDPAYHDYLECIKGARNGLVYGAKIRFPHALVMTFLFRNGSLFEKAQWILSATFQHSKNLGRFVFLYKAILLLAKRGSQGREYPWHHLLAGGLGGFLVFRHNDNVNQQVGHFPLILLQCSSMIVSSCYRSRLSCIWLLGSSQAFPVLPWSAPPLIFLNPLLDRSLSLPRPRSSGPLSCGCSVTTLIPSNPPCTHP